MPAPRDDDYLSVPLEEWQAVNARLLEAERKLETLESGGPHEIASRGDDFLASLAHELRNPLAPIRSAVEIMRLIGQQDTALRTALDVISRQVDQLTRVVDDLLDVSQLHQGKIQLASERVDVNAILWRAVETVQPTLDDRKHALKVTPLAEPATVQGDFARLVQVVAHLLESAAKCTESGGEISLGARVENELATISVADNGDGIAPDLLPHVFDIVPSASRDKRGIGLGLSVVRELVRLHGGTVEARSAGPGQGSQFIVILPLLHEPARVYAPVETQSGREMTRRIVVIDDNHDAAESLAMLLRLKGHDVQIAYDGPEGLALALESKPDCALIDIGLPGLDGYEVAKRLRARDGGMLLVALTGYGQEEDRTRSRLAGFDHHVVKPVAQGVLEDLLRER